MKPVGVDYYSSDPLKLGLLERERCCGSLKDVKSDCFSSEIEHWANFFSFYSNCGDLDFFAQPLDDYAKSISPFSFLFTQRTSQQFPSFFAFKGNNLSVLRQLEKINFLFSTAFNFFLISMALLAGPKTLWLLFRSTLKVYSRLGCS